MNPCNIALLRDDLGPPLGDQVVGQASVLGKYQRTSASILVTRPPKLPPYYWAAHLLSPSGIDARIDRVDILKNLGSKTEVVRFVWARIGNG